MDERKLITGAITKGELDFLSLLECPICCDFLVQAIETPCCHSLFCKECLGGWKKSNANSCPLCRKNFDNKEVRPNIPIQRFVDNIPMDCPFKIEGCTATPPRSELERHKQLCQFQPSKRAEAKLKQAANLTELKKKIAQLEKQLQGNATGAFALKKISKNGKAELELIKMYCEQVDSYITVQNMEQAALSLSNAAQFCHDVYKLAEKTPLHTQFLKELAQVELLMSKVQEDQHKYSEALDSLAKTLEFLKTQTAPEAKPLIVELLYRQGNIFFKSGKYDEADQTFVRALELATTEYKIILKLRYAVGLIAKKRSDYTKGTSAFQKAMEFYEKLEPKQQEEVDNDWMQLVMLEGDILRKRGNLEGAKELYLKILGKLETKFGGNHPMIAEICNNLGLLTKKEGKYGQAIEYYKTALKIAKHFWVVPDNESKTNKQNQNNNTNNMNQKKNNHNQNQNTTKGNRGAASPANKNNNNNSNSNNQGEVEQGSQLADPVVGTYLVNLGDIYRKQGEFQKAAMNYTEALNIFEKTVGNDHPEVAEVLNSMGLIKKKESKYDDAENMYVRALQIIRKAFGEEHYKMGIYGNNLGDIYRKRGQYPLALETYERSLKALDNTLGENHIESADILHNIGQVMHQLEKYHEALKFYNRALEITKKAFGENHYKIGMFLSSAGLTYGVLGQYDQSHQALKQSMQILISCLGQSHVEVADCAANLGDICVKQAVEAQTSKKDPNTKLTEARKYYLQGQKIISAKFGPDHPKSQQYQNLLYICDSFHSF